MKLLKAFGRFWYDFIIGDDWKIAIAIASALGLLLVLLINNLVADKWLAPIGGALIITCYSLSLLVDTRRDKKDR